MPCVTLYTDSPALLGHSEHKSPAILRIQVGIGQHQEALVRFKLNVCFEVIKNLSGMKLLDPGIRPYTCLDYFLLFEYIKAAFEVILSLFGFCIILALGLLDSNCTHSSKEYLENRLHVVDQHLLKLFLLLV